MSLTSHVSVLRICEYVLSHDVLNWPSRRQTLSLPEFGTRLTLEPNVSRLMPRSIDVPTQPAAACLGCLSGLSDGSDARLSQPYTSLFFARPLEAISRNGVPGAPWIS